MRTLPFDFDRTWTFGVPPDELWSVMTRTGDFPSWWSWLRRCETGGLAPGAVARCEVQAPLPYVLRFDVHVDRLEEGRLVETTVRGDLAGPARLEIERADGTASAARLAWSLDVRAPLLRSLAVVARPAMVWAHDRIVAVGVAQFERRALSGADGDGHAR
ncbi:MAG TPA: SRPBCC family protein [Acidimicrobiia bacterium]|nr:SRPBCC family protein [Acidimicrobiia bacterium]